jgi:hypothetical protein
MLRTVCKKVGKTVELEIFPASLGALPNNPPQRGGLKHTPKGRPERAMPIRFCTALSGRLFCVTHHPPRCGGLLCVAPEGAKEKLIFNLCVT